MVITGNQETEVLRHDKLIAVYCALLRMNHFKSQMNWLDKDKTSDNTCGTRWLEMKLYYNNREMRTDQGWAQKLRERETGDLYACECDNVFELYYGSVLAGGISGCIRERNPDQPDFHWLCQTPRMDVVCRNAHSFVCHTNASVTIWSSKDSLTKAINNLSLYLWYIV